jgi:primosomal protein N' (replication factor Y)
VPGPLLIRVAVPVPQLDLLTYKVSDGSPQPHPGARVVVPLGSRILTGIIVDLPGSAPDDVPLDEIKPIRRLLDDEPFVPEEVVGLALWTAEYYAAGIGETLTAALPPKTRGERRDSHKTERVASITQAGLEALPASRGKSRELLLLLADTPNGRRTAELGRMGLSAALISRLAGKGLASLRRERVDRDPFPASSLAAQPESGERELTCEQRRTLSRLEALSGESRFRVALLRGVTGSGKTEIYIRLARIITRRGRSVLMLVPEIALTPAVASQFRDAFGSRVAIQHSGLSDGERHDQWQRIRAGAVDVVVGTRSAVFAPLERVGLIIVDEEHDASYKQDEAPRYNGRDVAVLRGQRAGALVVLGSATPSLESYRNAQDGKYEHLVLERRVFDRPLPAVTIVDMRTEYAASGPDVVLSSTLIDALRMRADRKEQALVLLNRRGFATALFCRQCGDAIDCPHCSVSLVVHGAGTARHLRCHYCNHSAPVPLKCPDCGGTFMEHSGFGTERVEEELVRACPGVRVARLDRDATRRKGALAALLQQFRDGAIDVLVGTQMIAKGHDFPRVTLVGVVSADVGLGVADFRAAERTFQLLTQVAGRAGRGEHPGEAIVQTLYPDHYSIQLACRQDYVGFCEQELRFRQAMRYPPLISLVNVVVRAPTMNRAMADAADLAGAIRRHAGSLSSLRVLGPAPAALSKLRGEYRAQLLVKGVGRKSMREGVRRAIAERPAVARRTTVDVDPLSVV